MDDLTALQRRLDREQRARKEAEKLLEEKSRALFASVEESRRLTRELQQTVNARTQELLNAQRIAKVGTIFWEVGAREASWSSGVSSILGFEPGKQLLSTRRYLEFVVEEDRALLRAQVDRIVKSGPEPGEDYELTHRIKRTDGQIRWIKGLSRVTQSDNRDKTFVAVAIQDITELRLADDRVAQTQEQLRQRLQELENTRDTLEIAKAEAEMANHTKSRFIAMISHEIRTPINGLLGTLSLLADSKLDASQNELLKVATASGENLRVLLNDVIDFSRLETGDIQLEPTAFSLRILATQIVTFWRPKAQSRGNQISLEIDPKLPERLVGDSARIGQVLNNLVSNAIKFTRDGTVTVRIQEEKRTRSDTSACFLKVEVADTGVGIAPENLASLFREFSQITGLSDTQIRFFDAVGQERGAGLGLAICRSLVERMGGNISVSSALGEGSSFVFRLPLEIATDSDEGIKREQDFAPLRTLENKKPRVLIAEDVPANQLVARLILEKFGCSAEIADDGIGAVDACQRQLYDLVLMDVSMPRMDGIDATRQIRALPNAEAAAVPIIGLTAFAFTEEWARLYDAGMDKVITKPIRQGLLYEEIRSILKAEARPDEKPLPISGFEVDFGVLDKLTKGFSAEQSDRIFEQVSHDLDERRKQAIANAKAGNLAELSRACHAIKGLAGSFGGKALADLAGKIEGCAVTDDAERAFATTLDQLGRATDTVLDGLKRYADTLKAASRHG